MAGPRHSIALAHRHTACTHSTQPGTRTLWLPTLQARAEWRAEPAGSSRCRGRYERSSGATPVPGRQPTASVVAHFAIHVIYPCEVSISSALGEVRHRGTGVSLPADAAKPMHEA